MADVTMARLGDVAEHQVGLITTRQAEQVGVARKQLSRMASAGAVERVMHGVYRLVGAPEHAHELTYATWLALGGADRRPGEVPPVIAAGVTATVLHEIGDFFPDGYEFVVPSRRGTRLQGVRLRVREMDPLAVTHVDGLSVMTIERTIADLVEQWTDLSLVGDTIRDAIDQHRLVWPRRLVEYLAPLAARNGFDAGDGAKFADRLFELAGAQPDGSYR